VYLLIGTSTSVSGSCFAEYSPSNNAFSLFLDAGPPDAVPAQVGHDASNRQCTLSGSGLGATQSGNNLIVTFPVTFSGSYQGSKNIYLLTYDIQGRSGGWQKMGTWDVALFSTGPSVVSLTPTQGVGQNGTFIATFLHPGGASQHYLGYILFLPTPNVVQYTATGSCLVEYNRISDAMRLINDAGTNWLPGTMGIALNRGGSLTNSHCTLDVTHSSAHINGITMIVTVAVTFSASFTGQLATFMQAFDVTGAYSGMTQFGNWMGAPGTQKPGPYVVGVSPTSGAGTSTKMSFTAGHTKGLSALSFVTVLINSVIVGGVPCQIFYFLAANTLNLVNDGGTAMLSTTGIAPGTAGSLANSRCAIDAGGASRVISGNNVTVKLPLTFNAETLGGAQNVYVNAFDNVGMLSHWVLGGSWSVQ
jgi:hypothetical protein